MIQKVLTSLFTRDLEKLKLELNSYQQESNIWKVEQAIFNSSGNLCLHVIGNLNWFIGSQLGNTDYKRNREQEFSLTNTARETLLKMLDDTTTMVAQTLRGITEEDLEKEYPLLVFHDKMTTMFFLTHLATHLSYHLGQINYHRRLLDV